LLTFFFVQENFTRTTKPLLSFREICHTLPDKQLIFAMFITTFTLQLALFSIEPVITIYISTLSPNTTHLAFISGLVFASSGLSSMLVAPRLGKLADKVGAHKVILIALFAASFLFIPQAFVSNEWQLMGLRFLVGIATGALLPSINTMLKQSISSDIAGRIFSYNQTAQFLGMFFGSVFGGQIAAHFGIRDVFFMTSSLLFLNGLWVHHNVYKKASHEFEHAVPHS